MVHVDDILPIRTPAQRCVPLNLYRRGNVKYVGCRTTFEVDDFQTPARVLLYVVVPERDQFSIRRNCGPDRDAVCNSFRRAAVDRETPQRVRVVRIGVLEQDPLSIGRKRGPGTFSLRERQLLRTTAVAIDSPELKNTAAVGVENDVAIIGRNNGRIISAARRRQRPLIATRRSNLENVSDAARV